MEGPARGGLRNSPRSFERRSGAMEGVGVPRNPGTAVTRGKFTTGKFANRKKRQVPSIRKKILKKI
ncbi:MAG TPA: hypothetical protein DCP61_03960 [Treponema sp.]|nr:hypothetical protein [Treponema sp.]